MTLWGQKEEWKVNLFIVWLFFFFLSCNPRIHFISMVVVSEKLLKQLLLSWRRRRFLSRSKKKTTLKLPQSNNSTLKQIFQNLLMLISQWFKTNRHRKHLTQKTCRLEQTFLVMKASDLLGEQLYIHSGCAVGQKTSQQVLKTLNSHK